MKISTIRQISIICLLFSTGTKSHAQSIQPAYYPVDPDIFLYDLVELIPESVIDTIDYTVYYWRKYRMNPDKTELVHDRWALDIGSRYSRFYSVASYRNNLNHTKIYYNKPIIDTLLTQLDKELASVPKLPVSEITRIEPYEILCDYTNNELVFTDQIPLPSSEFIYYQ